MNIDAIMAQIKANVPELRTIGGSVQMGVAEEQLRTTPAAFVLPADEVSGPNTLSSGAVSQLVTATFTVVIAVANYADSTGKSGHDSLQEIREKVLACLIGWPPPDTVTEVTHTQGNLALYNQSTLWWRDSFSTQFYRRKT